jgi:haloalkane dehalogenase
LNRAVPQDRYFARNKALVRQALDDKALTARLHLANAYLGGFHEDGRETFQNFRTPGVGKKMILEGNAFVEEVLPAAIVRTLTDEEMSVYRAPFPTPESRRPTWRFPNELPIAGEPVDVYSTLEKAHRALAHSSYQKLLFTGTRGVLVSPSFAESFTKELQNCRVVPLGAGRHYLQEDHAEVIGATVNEWLIDLGVGSSPNTS